MVGVRYEYTAVDQGDFGSPLVEGGVEYGDEDRDRYATAIESPAGLTRVNRSQLRPETVAFLNATDFEDAFLVAYQEYPDSSVPDNAVVGANRTGGTLSLELTDRGRVGSDDVTLETVFVRVYRDGREPPSTVELDTEGRGYAVGRGPVEGADARLQFFADRSAVAGDPVAVPVTVTNDGTEPVTVPMTVTVDGTAVANASVTVPSGGSETATPNATFPAVGTYAVRVNDARPVTVWAGPEPLYHDRVPGDPDGDGLYEDVNGDGEATFADAIALAFVEFGDLSTGQVDSVDFDGDGDADFHDAVTLAFRV
jgi:hypothetical protein